MSLKEARTKVTEIRHRLQVEQKPVKTSSLTFKQFIEDDFKTWVMSARRDEQGTYDRLRYHFIDTFPHIGNTKLRDLTSHQFEHWKLKALETRKPSTVKRVYGDAHRALGLAVEWGLIRNNPLASVKPPAVDYEATRLMLTDAQFERLQKAIGIWEYKSLFGTPMEQRLHPRWFVLYVHIALATGARPREILALTWDDIDQDGRMITFRGTNTKTGRTRRVPVSEKLLGMLQAYNTERSPDEGEGARIFPIQPKADSLRAAWRRFRQLSGLDIDPYTLRHHTASSWLRRGASLATVRDLLGHTNVATTSRYLSVLVEEKFEVVNLL